MKRIIILTGIVLISINTMAQKLSLNQMVNEAYGSKVELATDSLLYILSECSPFIEIKPNKNDEIAIVVFKNREQLVNQLSEADAYLVKVSLTEGNLGKLIIRVTVYIVNNKIFKEKENYSVFHDERTIECILNDKERWVYSRTLNVKSHLTD